jgi:hypothetical protein
MIPALTYQNWELMVPSTLTKEKRTPQERDGRHWQLRSDDVWKHGPFCIKTITVLPDGVECEWEYAEVLSYLGECNRDGCMGSIRNHSRRKITYKRDDGSSSQIVPREEILFHPSQPHFSLSGVVVVRKELRLFLTAISAFKNAASAQSTPAEGALARYARHPLHDTNLDLLIAGYCNR